MGAFRTIRGAAVVCLVSGCTLSSFSLDVAAIEPAAAPNTDDVPVTITGSGFHMAITSNLDENTTVVDDTLAVTVGDATLGSVVWQGEQLISGIVPPGLALGTHDVTVTFGNRTGVLPDGYTVIGDFAPLHLAPGDGLPGAAQVTLSGTVIIDTTVPSINVSLPSGDSLDVHPQLGGGEVAVLHVGALAVGAGAIVTVIGSRPLVIVAGGSVDIAGTIAAGGQGIVPGPGGAASGMGSGAGVGGTHEVANASDAGGGGGGYGGSGATGGAISGACTLIGGTGGAAFGDAAITQLVGGSGGASSSGLSCLTDPGGAGGGALQISSATRIAIAATGIVDAGGGGGPGGTDCAAADGDVNSAPGGGSGGSIVLQAPMIDNAGVISANGGGGGGSSQTGLGSGMTGQNGQPGSGPAAGGTGPRANGGVGGCVGNAPGVGNGAGCGANAAGGGGGVGRIAVSTSFGGAGVVSPAPDTSLPP